VVSERYLCEAFTGVCCVVVCAWFHTSIFSGFLLLGLWLWVCSPLV